MCSVFIFEASKTTRGHVCSDLFRKVQFLRNCDIIGSTMSVPLNKRLNPVGLPNFMHTWTN